MNATDITAITALWIMVSLFLAVVFEDPKREPPRILVPSIITAGAALSLLEIVIIFFGWFGRQIRTGFLWLFAYRD
jgi:hypothetical protein